MEFKKEEKRQDKEFSLQVAGVLTLVDERCLTSVGINCTSLSYQPVKAILSGLQHHK